MLGKEMLTAMFAFSNAMNLHLLDCADRVSEEQLDAPSEYSEGGIRVTLRHVLGVEWEWGTMGRTRKALTSPPPFFQNPTLAAMRGIAAEEAAAMRTFLDGATDNDLRESFAVERSGRTKRFVVWEVLVHRAYHSAQHRSEAADLLTQYGQSPGDMDFLYFLHPELR